MVWQWAGLTIGLSVLVMGSIALTRWLSVFRTVAEMRTLSHDLTALADDLRNEDSNDR